MDEVSRTGEVITILKRGEPVAQLVPPVPREETFPQHTLFGTVDVHGDLTKPAVAAEVASLPDSFHRDPADRIIVASARIAGATLLTNDKRIIDTRVVPILQ